VPCSCDNFFGTLVLQVSLYGQAETFSLLLQPVIVTSSARGRPAVLVFVHNYNWSFKAYLMVYLPLP
jgi:hypothetical protein